MPTDVYTILKGLHHQAASAASARSISVAGTAISGPNVFFEAVVPPVSALRLCDGVEACRLCDFCLNYSCFQFYWGDSETRGTGPGRKVNFTSEGTFVPKVLKVLPPRAARPHRRQTRTYVFYLRSSIDRCPCVGLARVWRSGERAICV